MSDGFVRQSKRALIDNVYLKQTQYKDTIKECSTACTLQYRILHTVCIRINGEPGVLDTMQAGVV